MLIKRFAQSIVILAVVAAALTVSTPNARAWSGCSSYITVQWGDTLSGLAALCGTTVEAIRAANPGLGYWVYAGQVLYIPTGSADYGYYYAPSYGGTYVVQWGDTMYKIARRQGVTVNDLLAANPTIWDASRIYAGQVINLPATPVWYTVQYGDTLRIIAARYGTTVYSLLVLNPQITDANLIYPGQVLRVW